MSPRCSVQVVGVNTYRSDGAMIGWTYAIIYSPGHDVVSRFICFYSFLLCKRAPPDTLKLNSESGHGAGKPILDRQAMYRHEVIPEKGYNGVAKQAQIAELEAKVPRAEID